MRTRPALGSRVPPAVFTPLLGLFGLALAWRRAVQWGAPAGVGELLFGCVTVVWLFALALYAVKLVRRPAVLVEDAGALPGQSGLATVGVGGMALAAALVPYRPALAQAVLVLAVVWHAGFALLVARMLVSGPEERRRVTPLWHLMFVGFIVAPLAAVPLGWIEVSQVVLVVTLLVAVGIYAASARQFAFRVPPPPLRPLLAIHLAPLSIGGSVCALVGWQGASAGCAVAATVLALVLLASARWLTAAGFLPFWSAFTFPLSAYAGLMQVHAGDGRLVRLWAIVVLVVASGLIPWIAWRVLKLWPGGRLAAITNTATA